MGALRAGSANGEAQHPRKRLALALTAGALAYAGLLVWRIAPYLQESAVGEPGERLPDAETANRVSDRAPATSGLWPAPPARFGQAPSPLDRADAGGRSAGVPERRPSSFETERTPPSGIQHPGSRVIESPGTLPGSASDPEDLSSTPTPEQTQESRQGLLALAGWVLDEGGSAVSDLPVLARPRRLFAAADYGREGVSATEQRALTDAGGRFAFQQLPDGEYELRTEDNELYDRATAIVRAGLDSAVLVVETKSGRSLHVHGVVESARGGPLKGVRVELAGQPALAALSDEFGAYGLRLPVTGRLRQASLRFLREGYREERLTIGDGEALEAGELVRNVRLEPASRPGSLSGLVMGDDGSPVHRASVQLYSAGRGRRYQAASDQDGRFSLTGVEESHDYRLWVRPQGRYKDHVQDGVTVGSQRTTLDVVLESLGVASLRGSMVDPEGRPLPGFSLWLRSAYGAPAKSIAVTGDSQGRFVVAELPEGPVTLGTHASPRLAVTGLELAGGEVREVRVPLDVGDHRLEGHLLTPKGEPVAGARVSLHCSLADGTLSSRSFRETVSDASGYFLFTQLGSGAHTLSVTAPGFRSARLEQRVGSDTTPLRIQLLPSP